MKTNDKGSIAVAVLLSVAAFALMALAAEKEKHGATKDGGFDRIKALAGEWTVTKGGGEDEHHGGNVSYKVTAGGSAVQETLFGGTEHEMVTMYYADGDNLELTHYCMLQNRPHMRAEPSSSDKKIVFKCVSGKDNKIEDEMHMHEL